MPSHRGLSSPTKEDYRICLLVDRHGVSFLLLSPPSRSLLSHFTYLPRFLSHSLPLGLSLTLPYFVPVLQQFLSPERNAMATLRGTKFRRKFLRKSHCHLSRSLIRRTYRSPRRVSSSASDGGLSFAGALVKANKRFYYRLKTVVLNARALPTYLPVNLICLRHSGARIIGSC